MNSLWHFTRKRLRGTFHRYDVQQQRCTIPNLITGFGIASVFYYAGILLGILPGTPTWLPFLALGIIFSDVLDGIAADTWDQHTHLGQLLDPIRDRLFTAVLLYHLYILQPDWWMLNGILLIVIIEAVLLLDLYTHQQRQARSIDKLRAGGQWTILLSVISLCVWFDINHPYILLFTLSSLLVIGLLAIGAYLDHINNKS